MRVAAPKPARCSQRLDERVTGAWHAIGRQLRHPTGVGGWAIGQAMRVVNKRPLEATIAALNVGPADHVLDLGCGPGSGLALMATIARWGAVYGIDQSDAMVRMATRRNRKAVEKGLVAVSRADFAALPLEDDSVDRILACNVAYFWHDEQAVMAEIRRVLRPGGSIAIFVTEAATMQSWPFASADTHRHFCEDDMATMLHRGGADPEGIECSRLQLGDGITGLVVTAGWG
jgi:SAM-dependent methyltransferase